MTDENKENRTMELNNSKLKDSSSKIIFGDPVLCSQFLRGYTEIEMLKDVQPEDIEDVTERYIPMFTEERNSDIVKKVHIKNSEIPFYLISLIEHKSKVDYNVVMQILRYMVFIWEDYERNAEKQKPGISKTKMFKYPPVLPIVYYDGADNWTAALELKERIYLSDVLKEYIPDFKCLLVQLNQYSNQELMKRDDELSVIMMINKLHEAADFSKLGEEITSEYLQNVTQGTPEYLLGIISKVVEVLLLKLKLPREEVELFTEQIKEREMGELFANFKGYDVPAMRKKLREEMQDEVRAEVKEMLQDEVRAEVREMLQDEVREEVKKEIKEEVKEKVREEVKEEVREEVREEEIQKTVFFAKSVNVAKKDTKENLMKLYELTEEEAVEKIELYW